ncbi:ATP-dependent DNA helicase [Aquabacterium sp. J223]|uniref:ATP-dependent DNA helicase n=1 Tax=Aquabacterium sp. J223 TaxID=2898431 RepID=UPI0021AD5F66|nr:ATP-dependent DNA helicase [Aquabacterium sp. J223]UUX96412.1 ATP-dependent DNA helicase [Aquabacterium sp. J223]
MSAGRYTVAVRALCEFAAKAGDLDLRFTPSPTAEEGQAGHALVRQRRGAGWQAELPLQADHHELTVRGRADGFDAARGRLEEVKTFRGDLARQPERHRALHWAQAQVYGALLCRERGLASVELALVYLDLGSGRETVIAERHDAASLQARFEALCDRFLAWARQELAHRQARDEALAALAFPHPGGFRRGQRELAESVFRAARGGRTLLAQAPTGIGKTVGTLFPLLKAMPHQSLDRVAVLTARTPGRALALQAVATLHATRPGLPLRTLELVGRDTGCERPDAACHGESCPLARGFYDRLPAARQAAVALPMWDRPSLRALALAHEVCPYHLSHELARWADVVVGDYHHWFDGHALLHALAQQQGWRIGLLVDEAHNLVERARGMYSAMLDPATLGAARRQATGPVRRSLSRLAATLKAVQRAADAAPGGGWAEADGSGGCYRLLPPPDGALLQALQAAAGAVSEHLATPPAERSGTAEARPGPGEPAVTEADLQALLFDLLAFARRLEDFGDHALFDETAQRQGSRLTVRNVVPAPFVAPRLAAAHSATLFSATLAPTDYHRRLLGLPADTVEVDIASPFDAAQLAVHVAPLSTRWQHRSASIGPIVSRIAAQYDRQPGHYLAFFSSFDYLQRVADALAEARPDVPQWCQSRGMPEDARERFLARFVPGGRGIGFAVLGGAFGEGIDLPGDRLVGAFVATLGLPQVNPVNEQIRLRLQAWCGDGFRYAYLYPGVQKVVQAAGRVIRTPQDRGVVHLLDERFARGEVRALLPRWWPAPAVADGALRSP